MDLASINQQRLICHKTQPSLNKGLLSNFWWLGRAKNGKFIEECVTCMKKHILVKKYLKWAKHGIAITSLNGGETHWFSKKENFQNILDTKGPITIDFLVKGAVVKSNSYYQLLWKYLSYWMNEARSPYTQAYIQSIYINLNLYWITMLETI